VIQLCFPDPPACAPPLSSARSLAPPLLVLLHPFVKVSFFFPQEETCSSLLVLIPLVIFLLLLLPPSSVPWSLLGIDPTDPSIVSPLFYIRINPQMDVRCDVVLFCSESVSPYTSRSIAFW
jgi:hypothetical protein